MKATYFILLTIILYLSTPFFVMGQDTEKEFISPLISRNSMVGGAIGVVHDKGDLDSQSATNPDFTSTTQVTNISFSPYYAYGIRNTIFVGSRLIFNSNQDESLEEDDQEKELTVRKFKGVGIGVFARKYVTLINKFGLYVSPELSYQYQKVDRDFSRLSLSTNTLTFESKVDTNGDVYNVSVDLGLYFLVNEKLSVETNLGSIGFNHASYDSKNNEEATLFQSNSTLEFSFTNTLTFNRIFAINYFF